MSNNFPGVTFTVPVDALTDARHFLDGHLQRCDPAPRRNSSSARRSPPCSIPSSPAGGFQFGIVTLAGHTHTIQARTNVAGGSWLDLTNVTGDGSLQQFTFPTTNPRARFFRVRSH